MKLLAETEGIIPALESAHAVAYAAMLVPRLRSDQLVIINLSGRGDKDLQGVARFLGELHQVYDAYR
jgi:tryptophan synthase beta chain